MIMTYQNPLDWASEAFYDSEENENSELERDPEIIFKTYLKELFFLCFHLRIVQLFWHPDMASDFTYVWENGLVDFDLNFGNTKIKNHKSWCNISSRHVIESIRKMERNVFGQGLRISWQIQGKFSNDLAQFWFYTIPFARYATCSVFVTAIVWINSRVMYATCVL